VAAVNRRNVFKIAVPLFAVLALSAFLVMVPAVIIDAEVPESIELNGVVEQRNCAPCHIRLDEPPSPGMIFSHGAHIMVACETCHIEPAHEAGEMNSPPMVTCFACHGVVHGQLGEIASGECSECHTVEFQLRPRTHTLDWAEKPHAEVARTDTNSCMMCHTAAEECDTCHTARGLDIGPMPAQYISVLPEVPDQPLVTVYPTQPTSISQCIYCHPDIDDISPGRIIFAHSDHLRRNYDCVACHPTFGHDIEAIRRPDKPSCFRCHDTAHSQAGTIATGECAACHPPGFELKPPDHTPAFESRDHRERGKSEPEYCLLCHEAPFCVECHLGRRPTGPGSEPVIPADHRTAEWMSLHGRPFLEQQGACGICHDSPSCMTCHETVMPHPDDWLTDHTPDPGVGREDCDVCHVDQTTCQSCHHEGVRRAELTRENCVPCHEGMAHQPATEIRHKGYAEHAVHFDVARTRGEPYRCYDCHIGFGRNVAGRVDFGDAAHDMRLCYECHGTLDVFGTLIAPYRGADLCRQCHGDMGI